MINSPWSHDLHSLHAVTSPPRHPLLEYSPQLLQEGKLEIADVAVWQRQALEPSSIAQQRWKSWVSTQGLWGWSPGQDGFRASFFQMESLPSGQSPPMWDKVGIQHYFPIFPRLISFFHVNSDWLLWKNSQLVIKLRPLLKRSGKGASEKTSLGCIFHEVSWKKKSWSSSLIHN